mmetsp:Transcript_90938/g.284417  ORF Transcript_90938/g.284417 Transcript_90938/m.284417 type:complete len:318 (+) Transcript_90938:2-955(+)
MATINVDALRPPLQAAPVLCIPVCGPVQTMVASACCCPVAVFVTMAIVLLWLRAWVALEAEVIVMAFLALVAVGSVIFAYKDRRRMDASTAAELMHNLRAGQAGLPDALRGVFWFSDNVAPELLVAFDEAGLDPLRRRLVIVLGSPYNWTYGTNCCGWLEWLLVSTCGVLACARLRLDFDAAYHRADLFIDICKCITVNRCMVWDCCQRWTMQDISGEAGRPAGTTWRRDSFCTCCGQECRTDSYVLRKVVGSNGQKLQPEFNAMLETLQSPERPGVAITRRGFSTVGMVKPLAQFMQGPRILQCAPAQEEMQRLVP